MRKLRELGKWFNAHEKPRCESDLQLFPDFNTPLPHLSLQLVYRQLPRRLPKIKAKQFRALHMQLTSFPQNDIHIKAQRNPPLPPRLKLLLLRNRCLLTMPVLCMNEQQNVGECSRVPTKNPGGQGSRRAVLRMGHNYRLSVKSIQKQFWRIFTVDRSEPSATADGKCQEDPTL